ncbi:MAG: hypothetical protein ACPLXS_02950 [Candidatus Micrarchaeales archaeon]
MQKVQAAMEYLMTYGWAILIIGLAIGVLYSLGLFNPSSIAPSYCVFSGGAFLCKPFSIDANGYLSLTLTSNYPNPINVTQIACNAWGNLSYAYTIPGGVVLYPPSTYSLPSNVLQCRDRNGNVVTGVKTLYKGKIVVAYRDLVNNFKYTAVGDIQTTLASI